MARQFNNIRRELLSVKTTRLNSRVSLLSNAALASALTSTQSTNGLALTTGNLTNNLTANNSANRLRLVCGNNYFIQINNQLNNSLT